MSTRRMLLGFITAIASIPAMAANPEAGKAMVESVCAVCHGIKGLSAAPGFPHLAGQQDAYLRSALTAYREGTRQAPIMNNIAAGLNDEQIDNLAAYLSSLKRCE